MYNIQLIDISKIQQQKKVTNRDKDTKFSTNLLELEQSIRTNGLVVPIIVRKKTNDSYELFAGYRRLKVYESLLHEDNKYQLIEAIVRSASTTNKEMIAIKIAENNKRKNLSKAEDIEEKISSVPFFFPGCESDSIADNLDFGFSILKHWNTYTRSKLKKHKSLEALMRLTKSENPYQHIRDFFDTIGENERTFYDNASSYMNSPKEVINLIYKRKISFTRAKQINAMKSEEDKEKLIRKLIADKKKPDKDIKSYIDKSNLNANPDLWFRSTAKYLEKLSNLLETKTNKNLSLNKQKDIATHIDLIHHILIQKENSA